MSRRPLSEEIGPPAVLPVPRQVFGADPIIPVVMDQNPDEGRISWYFGRHYKIRMSRPMSGPAGLVSFHLHFHCAIADDATIGGNHAGYDRDQRLLFPVRGWFPKQVPGISHQVNARW